MRNKEIGSTYWLPPSTQKGFSKRFQRIPHFFDSVSFVSTCRSAIGIVLDELSPSLRKVALLPAFTCESVLVSFLDRGYEVYPYPIRRNLTIDWTDFHNCVLKIRPTIVLVHSYFGFDTISELRSHVQDLRDQGIIVIEDETQSMFSKKVLASANYYVGSIRKWMPLPDGAFVSTLFHDEKEDIELVEAKMEAFIQKGNWVLNGIGEKSLFQQSFIKAESILNSRKKTYSMSAISRQIFANTDIEAMKDLRRDNCQTLLNGIMTNKHVFNNLLLPISSIEENDCPFLFPVLVKDRRIELQAYLAQHSIYATIIWRCPDIYKNIINDDSKYVYDHILCFHVDQRYDKFDMIRIINTLKEYYS